MSSEDWENAIIRRVELLNHLFEVNNCLNKYPEDFKELKAEVVKAMGVLRWAINEAKRELENAKQLEGPYEC